MSELPRSLPEVLRKTTRGALNEVHTALPGKVTAYDATNNVADVELQVSLAVFDDDDGRTYEDPPILPKVPVVWPRAGGYVVTLPLAAGDGVLVLFSEASLAEWRMSGQKSKPTDARRHSLGYPVCIPGLFPDVSALAAGDVATRQAGVLIGKDGGAEQITIAPGVIAAGKLSAGALPLPTMADFATLYGAMSTLATALAAATTIVNVATAGGVAKTALTGYTPAYTTLFKAK